MTPQQQRRAKKLRELAVARQTVVELDHGFCRVCGAVGTAVHHIFGRVGNLLTDTKCMILLCEKCHREAHIDLKESRVTLMQLLEER